MAPVTQYVFAEMLGISEHFTAGSHEWLPYSVIPTFPKLICKHQFISPLHCPQNKFPGGGGLRGCGGFGQTKRRKKAALSSLQASASGRTMFTWNTWPTSFRSGVP